MEERFDIDGYIRRSRKLDTDGIRWDEVGRHPLPAEALRTLTYMQDIETHTIVYVRELLSTRAIDDEQVATFFACWFYEETFHGRALADFLRAAGREPIKRKRSAPGWGERFEAAGIAALARLWPDFVAVHMTWGAINELTTLCAYKRLSALAGHPVLTELLGRITLDESRHFQFYFDQARLRLARPRTARITRFLVEHFWDPVGAGVQPDEEVRFLATYLFSGPDGRAAAQKVDDTIRRLPGFEGVPLLEAWLERATAPRPPLSTRLRCAPLHPFPSPRRRSSRLRA